MDQLFVLQHRSRTDPVIPKLKERLLDSEQPLFFIVSYLKLESNDRANVA